MKNRTVTLPNYDPETENFAEVGMAAWTAAHGGEDLTGEHGEPDNLGTWIGHDGNVYRLTVNEQTKEITAERIA